MQKYFDFAQDPMGNALGGASVLVNTLAGAVATIYSDSSSTALANPFNTRGDGYFEFYASNGHYNVVISKTGFNTVNITDLIINDPNTSTYFATAGGSADALTATFGLTAYVNGLSVELIALGANTSTTPTLTLDSLAAITIVKYGNQALVAGDIFGAGHVLNLIYRSSIGKFELMNPVYGIGVLGVIHGGTGLSSVAPGDTFYGSGTNTVAALAVNTNSTRYYSNQGVGNIPSWSQVNLTNGVTGTLAASSGGFTNQYVSVTGLGTTTRTYTFPDASTTVLTTNTTVTIPQGGTDRSSFTAYALLAGGTTTSAALQVVTLGTSGQVLTSNGTSALASFQTASGGGLVKLNSGTVSAAATLGIVMTAYTAYPNKIIVLSNFLPAKGGGDTLYMRFSTDGGSNYDSGAGNYTYCNYLNDQAAVAVTVANSAAATQLAIAGSISAGDGTTEGMESTITLYNTTSTARAGRAEWSCVVRTAGSAIYSIMGSGQRTTAQDTDAVQFLFAGGNIAAGSWALYGYS